VHRKAGGFVFFAVYTCPVFTKFHLYRIHPGKATEIYGNMEMGSAMDHII
jgi:hypothetical protein